MIKCRSIKNGEPVWFAGDNNFTDGRDGVAVRLNTRLQTLQGEVKNNSGFGIPLFDGLSVEDMDLEISQIILGTVEVIEIESFESSAVDRKYTATITVLTGNGRLEVVI